MTDDRFDNFPLMADKIRVRSKDKGFVVQSNDEAIKRCLYGVLLSFGVQLKTKELVRQIIFFESKGFHVANVVSADFFRVHGLRNVSLLVMPGHRPSSLQMTSK